MTPSVRRLMLSAAALWLMTSQVATATTLMIQPSSQDAYVTQQQPNHVFGSSPMTTRMFVQSSTPQPKVERGLVQFDLSMIPQFSIINSATLQINQQSAPFSPARIHGVHKVGASWLQSTVKWNTQPAANASPTSTATAGDSKGFKSFTVTSDVQAWINNPATNFGWMVRDQSENVGNNTEVGYVTREENHIPDIPKKPILTIDYTAPSCSTNADCQDTDACTTNERCQAGHCAVDSVNCDDSDACTDDICDPVQGCLHPIGECNDGFSCTIDTCTPMGGCVHTPVNAVCLHNGCQTGTCVADQNDNTLDPVTGCQVTSVAPDGTTCNDQNGCTQTDTCSAGECVGSSPVTCTPLDACHVAGTCSPGTGLCSNPPAGSGTTCNDSNACTQTDQCDGSGTCVGSNPVVCTALDQCHDVGTCNTGTGVCTNPNKANGSTCNDGDACTQTDQCSGGSCVGSNPVICTALDQCHQVGTCSPGTGMCSNPTKPDGSICSDGNGCTQTDTCTGGTCNGANPVVCTPLDQCHVAGTCSPGTGMCSNPPAGSGTTCNDSNACTQTDQCNGSGTCVGSNPVVCTPLDQCHLAGTCSPGTGMCSNPPAGSGTTCNDSNACTQTDQCNGSGTCVGGNPVVCTALDQCHQVGTCSPGTGMCSNPTKPDGSICSDGNGCTQTDTCTGGTCNGANPVVCTPLDQCHLAGTCSPGTGTCSNPTKPDGSTCSDGNACTQTDQCTGGSCGGGNPVVCTALDQCHDVGTCDTGTGACSNPNKANGSACNDSNACTQTDTCTGGSCSGGNPVVCTPLDQCHDVGTCDTGTGMCSNPNKANGSACNDSNACTQTDTCTGGSCSGGNPVVCTALDQCHDVGTCDTGTGACSNPNKSNGSACNDANACTQTDTCTGGSCVGGNPVVCTAQDDCHLAGTCDTGTGVCSNPTAGDGTGCSDGNACTLGDTCSGGMCIGNPTTCGDGIVQPSCNEECDAPGDPTANCTAQCRFICGPTPQAGCRQPVLAKKALVVLKNKTPDKKDVLIWKWIKGSATLVADFGTPLTTTGYTLCVYDSSANPQPLLLSMAPPGGTCHGKACWKTTKTGFKYKDKDLTPDGLSFILEKAGADKIAKIIVKGKGANLGMPSLPLTPAVTVQLKKNDDPGTCWSAKFSTPIKNLSEQFKAKAD